MGVWLTTGGSLHWPSGGCGKKWEGRDDAFFLASGRVVGRFLRNTRLVRDQVVSSVGILYTNDATLSFHCEYLHRFIEISLLIL